MATNLYQATGTLWLKVEADGIKEAREEVHNLIDKLNAVCPVGVSFSIGEHHQSRKPHVEMI